MNDYIKREDAITVVYGQHTGGKEACLNARPNTFGADLREIVADIEDIPAADVVEIEPGAWILTDFDGNTMKIKGIQRERIEVENEKDVVERKVCHDTGESRVFRCSNCGYGVDDIFEDKDAPVYLFERFEYWHYCPNCGANLRKGGDT